MHVQGFTDVAAVARLRVGHVGRRATPCGVGARIDAGQGLGRRAHRAHLVGPGDRRRSRAPKRPTRSASSATRRRRPRSWQPPRGTPTDFVRDAATIALRTLGDNVGLMGRPKGAEERGNFGSLAGVLVFVAGCTTKEPTKETYFDRTIFPILQDSCGRPTPGPTATSMQAERQRDRQPVARYVRGPRQTARPPRQLRAVRPAQLPAQERRPVRPRRHGLRRHALPVRTDISHSGVPHGRAHERRVPHAEALDRERRQREQRHQPAAAAAERDLCSKRIPSDPAFNPDVDPTALRLRRLSRTASCPSSGEQCAAGNCHGSPSNSLRLACSTLDSRTPTSWRAGITLPPRNTSSATAGDLASSELLRRPLDPAAGGAYHEGGAIFPSQRRSGYIALVELGQASTGPTPTSRRTAASTSSPSACSRCW